MTLPKKPVYPDSPLSSSSSAALPPNPTPSASSKPPRVVLQSTVEGAELTIFAFAPNRDTLGGTSYFIVGTGANILVDCPPWDSGSCEFLQQQGGVRSLVFTHRDAIGKLSKVQAIQRQFECELVIQEQEAYLLPNMPVTAFGSTWDAGGARMLWTPGYSPGSACLYFAACNLLFTGRHLLPNPQGVLQPLRTAKTFHWPRQLRSLQHLQQMFTPETLQWICPGANLGFLRGRLVMDQAYDRMAQLDLEALRRVQVA